MRKKMKEPAKLKRRKRGREESACNNKKYM
jgi:hypothetical protein